MAMKLFIFRRYSIKEGLNLKGPLSNVYQVKYTMINSKFRKGPV